MPSESARNFGVQSYCFRHFKDNAEVASKVKQIGVDSIEVCQVHCDFGDASAHQPVIDTYADAGVRIASIGVQTFRGDEAKETNFFEFAKAAGLDAMSISFPIEDYRQRIEWLDAAAEKYGLKLAIHNHGGKHWLGNSEVLRHIFKWSSPRIGLCLDTAWCIDSGENPVKWVEEFGGGGRLHGIHYKDFTYAPDRQHQDVIVGSGILDLPALIAALDAVSFDGYAVIEYEAEPERPVPALTGCVQAMRKVL